MNPSNLVIDIAAYIGKVKVENSSLGEIEKEFAKIGINFGKEVVKGFVKTPIEKILDYAKLCDIKKITFYDKKRQNKILKKTRTSVNFNFSR